MRGVQHETCSSVSALIFGTCCPIGLATNAARHSAAKLHNHIKQGSQQSAQQSQLHRRWYLREQQGPNRKASRELLHRSPGRDGPVSRWNLQLQPQQTRNVFTSWRSCEMVMTTIGFVACGSTLEVL